MHPIAGTSNGTIPGLLRRSPFGNSGAGNLVPESQEHYDFFVSSGGTSHLDLKLWLLIATSSGVLLHALLCSLPKKVAGATPTAVPAPARTPPHTGVLGPSSAALLWAPAWLGCSVLAVLSNKYLFVHYFPHPLYLTVLHMLSCNAVCVALIAGPRAWKERMMPSVEKHITWPAYFKTILPIALLNGFTIGVGNLALKFAPVGILQMLKPSNILFAFIAGLCLTLEVATRPLVLILAIIISGVSVSSSNAVGTGCSALGIFLQLFTCMGSGVRVAMLQLVMTEGSKLDAITTLYYETPVAGFALALGALFLEGPVDAVIFSGGGLQWLALNCATAVVLNFLILKVIQTTSAVAFTILAILKDVAVIVVATISLQEQTTLPQILGYSVSIVGMLLYKAYKDDPKRFLKPGLLTGGPLQQPMKK